jgi:hypothetical protein
MDQPEIALNMIQSFLDNKPLRSGDSKVGVAIELLVEQVISNTIKESVLEEGVVCPISSSNVPLIRSLASILQDAKSVNLQLNGSQSAELIVKHRSLEAQTGFIPILVNVAPVSETSAFIRLKSHHHTLDNEDYFVLIQPGNRRLNVTRDWFAGNSHVDIILDGLAPGASYKFHVSSASLLSGGSDLSATNTVAHNLPFSARRTHVLHMGCFHSQFAPCCGHGDCIPGSSSNTSFQSTSNPSDSVQSHCHCEKGYVGDNCDHYFIHDQLVHGHDSEKDIVMCPAKPEVPHHKEGISHIAFSEIARVKLASRHRRQSGDSSTSSDIINDLNTSPLSLSDTLISFTQGCSGNCCLYVELALASDKIKSQLDNASLTLNSLDIASSTTWRWAIERSLIREIKSSLHASMEAMRASNYRSKKEVNLRLSVSPRITDSQIIKVFASLCGDVSIVNEHALQLARFIATSPLHAIDAMSSAIVPTFLRVLSNPHEVAELQLILASDQVPGTHIDSKEDNRVRNVFDSMVNSDLSVQFWHSTWKYALVFGLCLIIFLSTLTCSPSQLWARFVGKDLAIGPSVTSFRAIRKNAKV